MPPNMLIHYLDTGKHLKTIEGSAMTTSDPEPPKGAQVSHPLESAEVPQPSSKHRPLGKTTHEGYSRLCGFEVSRSTLRS